MALTTSGLTGRRAPFNGRVRRGNPGRRANGGKLRLLASPPWVIVRPGNRRARCRGFLPRTDVWASPDLGLSTSHGFREINGGSPMKRPRSRCRRRVALALLLLPPILWATVLAVTPTEWARTRIVAQLGRSTGRSVRLGSLRVGFFGSVYLAGLEIGAPGSGGDPWLKAPWTRINVSMLQLLAGQVEPSEIELRGLSLRVLRRKDGTLELADLLAARDPAEAATTPQAECAGPASLEVTL